MRRQIDVGKIVELDHLLNWKLVFHDKVDKLRNEFFWSAFALNYAAKNAAVLQEGYFDRDLVASARAAEQHASSTGASRNTAGSADVSAEYRTPPGAIARTSSTTLLLPL